MYTGLIYPTAACSKMCMDYFVCVTFHFFLSKNYKFLCPLGPENKLSYISTVEISVQQKYHHGRGNIGKVEISVQWKY